ncbi:MAG: permease-like cell division protein FtsX [Bacteroidales bacterium]|nr:permease-like cell division protein FtsX [Bacteroidales bacterium]
MSREENKIVRKRLANAYLSSVISISLVLLLVGVASLLILNARGVADYFKENMQISVLLKQEVSDSKAEKYEQSLQTLPFINSTRLVSKEEGTEEMKAMLGEDFLSVFESSPIPISIDITLKADYVSADSLDMVIAAISESPLVDEVSCQQSLIEALNANLSKISLILAVFIALMLFISFVLINNTVRLNVFSRRFTIHTMKLVGATKAFIRKPFMVKAVYQGLISAAVAIFILSGMLLFVKKSFAQLFEIFKSDILLLGAFVVIASGVLICVVSTYFVVNRLVSMSKDELYI